MRSRTIALAFLVGLISLSAGYVPAQTNDSAAGIAMAAQLVFNSSFEENNNGDNLPDHWTGTNLSSQDGWVCDQAHLGACSVHLVSSSTTGKKILFNRNIDGNKDEKITFQLWNKTLNAGENFRAQLTITYWDQTTQAWNIKPQSGTHGWQAAQVLVNPAKPYVRFDIQLISPANTGGQIWFDNVNLNVAAVPGGWTPPKTAGEWKNHPVRGAVIEIGFGGHEEYEYPPIPSRNSLRLLRELGVHVVVLEFQFAWTIKPPYRSVEAQYALVTRALDNIRDAGLYAVLSVRNGPGTNAMIPGIEDPDVITTLYTNTTAQQAYRNMLKEVVTRFKGREEIIAWEPLVEPCLDHFLFHEESPFPKASAIWNPLAASFIQTIRTVDPNRPIIIEPVNWGGMDGFRKLAKFNDNNVIYSLHTYEPYAYTFQDPPYKSYPGNFSGEYVNKSTLDSWLAPVDNFQNNHDVPILAGEWGGTRWLPGMNRYITDQVSLFDKRDWSWTIYAWYDCAWDEKGLILYLGSKRYQPVYNPFNPLFLPIVNSWASLP